MNRTIEMILMTLVIILAALFLGTTVTGCTSDDEQESMVYEDSELYAIVKPEGAQLIDIIPQDYVLTLNNIIAVNPETGEFILKNTGRIDSVAFPIPTQYVIQFYTKGSFLFEAKLTSLLSSTASSGLTFCHFISDKNGLARYDLSNIVEYVINPYLGRAAWTDTKKRSDLLPLINEMLNKYTETHFTLESLEEIIQRDYLKEPNSASIQFSKNVINGVLQTYNVNEYMPQSFGREIYQILPNKEKTGRIYRKRSGDKVIDFEIIALDTFKKAPENFGDIVLLLLNAAYEQNFPEKIIFPLQTLVDHKLYSNLDSSRVGLFNCYNPLQQIKLSEGNVIYDEHQGEEKYIMPKNAKGLFGNMESDNKGNVIIEFRAQSKRELFLGEHGSYISLFPKVLFAKEREVVLLADLIVSKAREYISKGINPFTISLEYARDYMGIPTYEEIKKYKQSRHTKYIKQPLLDAINKINEQSKDFHIDIIAPESGKVNTWLSSGKMLITLTEQYKRALLYSSKAEICTDKTE